MTFSQTVETVTLIFREGKIVPDKVKIATATRRVLARAGAGPAELIPAKLVDPVVEAVWDELFSSLDED